MASQPKLAITGLAKRYGSFEALAPTDLEVAEGEFLTLLGPSGSGKTTLLSLIAGLAAPDEGRLSINGRDATHAAPYERDIGMVFQNYALFPHMTIAENIAFPLKMRRMDSATAARRAMEALELVRLPQVASRYPKELSGGQQQRIALARCLVYKPSIVLMDEPLGALDKKLRDHMQLEIKRIHRDSGTTVVYVTHDQEEAMTMSDRICLMNGGRIEQLGTPSDLYFRPKSLFVADFIGESNLLPGTVAAADGASVEVLLADGATRVRATAHAPLAGGSKVRVMVRPQNMTVSAGPVNTLSGRVIDSMITGSLTKLYLHTPLAGDEPMVLSHPTSAAALPPAVGSELAVSWASGDAIAVPEAT
jgi:putative spermidine/putrescine transport system ATP-binding protein